MISIFSVIFICAIHFICNFIVKTDKEKKKKSSSNYFLLRHTIMYSVCFSVLIMLKLKPLYCFYFFLMSFFIRVIAEYFTFRLNKYLKERKDHLLWLAIGFNQFTHIAQLILTYWFLTKF